MTTAEAYEWIRCAQHLQTRLGNAIAQISERSGTEREQRWLTDAMELLKQETSGLGDILTEARTLPELEWAREDAVLELQGAWVDVLERLHAGITFHAGSRSPLLEAIFPHVKFGPLRRASLAKATAYVEDIRRRLQFGYVTRMLAQDDMSFAHEVIAQLEAAFKNWEGCSVVNASPEEQERIREGLIARGQAVELRVRQAKLLAEAAFAATPDAVGEHGLDIKPKKRSSSMTAHPAEPSADEAMDADLEATDSTGDADGDEVDSELDVDEDGSGETAAEGSTDEASASAPELPEEPAASDAKPARKPRERAEGAPPPEGGSKKRSKKKETKAA